VLGGGLAVPSIPQPAIAEPKGYLRGRAVGTAPDKR